MRRRVNPANVGRRGARWERAKRETFERWGYRCWWCPHEGAREVDHLIPISQGGDPYDLANLRPSHGSNSPCPVCVSPRTGRARCCNQERHGRKTVTVRNRTTMSVDVNTL